MHTRERKTAASGYAETGTLIAVLTLCAFLLFLTFNEIANDLYAAPDTREQSASVANVFGAATFALGLGGIIAFALATFHHRKGARRH